MQDCAARATQRSYSRLAGAMFLLVNVAYAFDLVAESSIRGSGGLVEVARRLMASEHTYRVALSSGVIAAVGTVILAWALYVTLEPIDARLSLVGLCLRIGEAAIFGVMSVLSFATVRLYATAQEAGSGETGVPQTLLSLGGSASAAGFNIAALFFAPASTLFFYLLFRSRYVPRAISVLGVFASVLVLPVALGSLVLPEYSRTIFYGWIPMALAETATGLWLVIVGVPLATMSVENVIRD
jgi:hypothetical protein